MPFSFNFQFCFLSKLFFTPKHLLTSFESMNFNVQLQIAVKIMPQIMEVCICKTWANNESWGVILYLDLATILEICGDIEHWNLSSGYLYSV